MIRMTLSYNTFNIAAGCGTWPHSMSDSSRERCKIREVRVNMMGLKSPEIFKFIRQRGIKGSANIRSIQWVAVGERGSQTLSLSVALQISQDRIALWIILLEVHTADLDKDLELIPDKDITGDRNVAIGGLVLEGDLGLNAENKGRVDIQGLFRCQPLGQSLRKVTVSNTSDRWME